MSSYVDAMAHKAYHSFPPQEYNRYREGFLDSPDPGPVFYEVSLMEERPWEFLRDRVYPAFARFLKYKDFDPESGAGTVVAVFLKNRCHLIKGKDFLDVFREIEGLAQSAFHFRVLQWLAEV